MPGASMLPSRISGCITGIIASIEPVMSACAAPNSAPHSRTPSSMSPVAKIAPWTSPKPALSIACIISPITYADASVLPLIEPSISSRFMRMCCGIMAMPM